MIRTSIFLAIPLALAAQPNVLLDNEDVRVVLSAPNKPGPKGRRHKHDMNRVMIYQDAGWSRLTFDGGRVKDIKFKAGEVLWDTAGEYHTSENPGTTPYRLIEVELKKPHGVPVTFGAIDPPKVAPDKYKVLIDNDQVRVIRFHCGPRAKMPMHDHSLPRVTVYLTDFHMKVTKADGSVVEAKQKAGDVTFAQPAKHSEESQRDQDSEVIAIELKKK
ncbi:MAG: hypothetical protein U0Q16_21460 [Bryobacteraceae bacterium]